MSFSEEAQLLLAAQNALSAEHNLTVAGVIAHPEEAIERLPGLLARQDELAGRWASVIEAGKGDPVSRADATACEPAVRENYLSIRAFLLGAQAKAFLIRGELARAAGLLDQSLENLGDSDPVTRSDLLQSLGLIRFQQGRLDESSVLLDEAARCFREWTPPTNPEGAGAEFFENMRCKAQAIILGYQANVALSRGNRGEFLRLTGEGIAICQAHGVVEILRTLWRLRYEHRLLWDLSDAVAGDLDSDLQRYPSLRDDPDFQVDLLIVRARVRAQRQQIFGAVKMLLAALEKAVGPGRGRWNVLMSLAGWQAELGQFDAAIASAEEARQIALGMRDAALLREAVHNLVSVLSASGLAEPRRQAASELERLIKFLGDGPPEELARALLARAWMKIEDRSYAEALDDILAAEKAAVAVDQLNLIATAKSGTLRRLGRFEEALESVRSAIRMTREQLAPPLDKPPEWRDMLRHAESLYASAAVLCAEMGRPEEAFRWAESGKSRLLRLFLAQSGMAGNPGSDDFGIGDLERLREDLARDNAALVMFSVGPDRTVAMVLEPGADRPRAVYAEIGVRELTKLLPGPGASVAKWNDDLFAALPELSRTLGPLVESAIGHANVLYLVPDSLLYGVPFPGIVLAGGEPLIERVAIAVVPSARIWQFCRRQRQPGESPKFLVAGAGGEPGLSFSDQARNIAEAGFAFSATKLLADASRAEFMAQAPRFDAVHIACHGIVDPAVRDPLSASRLLFEDGILTAREVAAELSGRMTGGFVFLNACRSGGFAPRLGSEAGGFWQAFLEAGVCSLVATVTYVHPESAQDIALGFYRNWRGSPDHGVTKAEALRQAQRQARARGLSPPHWATHILIGDHC